MLSIRHRRREVCRIGTERLVRLRTHFKLEDATGDHFVVRDPSALQFLAIQLSRLNLDVIFSVSKSASVSSGRWHSPLKETRVPR